MIYPQSIILAMNFENRARINMNTSQNATFSNHNFTHIPKHGQARTGTRVQPLQRRGRLRCKKRTNIARSCCRRIFCLIGRVHGSLSRDFLSARFFTSVVRIEERGRAVAGPWRARTASELKRDLAEARTTTRPGFGWQHNLTNCPDRPYQWRLPFSIKYHPSLSRREHPK